MRQVEIESRMTSLVCGHSLWASASPGYNSWFRSMALLRCIQTRRSTKGPTVVTIVAYLYLKVGYRANEGYPVI
jgi:hypothetical protein